MHHGICRLLLRVLPVSSLLAAGNPGRAEEPAGWARGDLHQHTRSSEDGTWEPAELVEHVRRVMPGVSKFIFFTDHSEIEGLYPNPSRPPRADNWGTWEEARQLRGGLLSNEYVATGQEIGGLLGGHIGAICMPQDDGRGPPTIVERKNPNYLLWMQRIHAAGGLNVVFHPLGVDEIGPLNPGTFTHWRRCLPLIDAIDVWNGYKNYDRADERAWIFLWRLWLAGHRPTAVAGSDAHRSMVNGAPVPYWGIEGRTSFHIHPMNPHVRARVGEVMTEDSIRDAIREGRVTLSDWYQNWMEVTIAARAATGGGPIGRIGDDVVLPGAVVLRAFGHGEPSIYSGSPFLEVRYGKIGDSRETLDKIPMVPGSFDVTHPLDLTPGTWVITARVLPGNKLSKYWRGVQAANPIRVRVEAPPQPAQP